MTDEAELEQRLLEAVHAQGADLELLAHDVASSEDAQAYLVELVATLSAVSPSNRAAERAAALLEHGLAIAAELGLGASTEAVTAVQTSTSARDRGDGRDD